MKRWFKILIFKLAVPFVYFADLIRNESAAGMPELNASDDDASSDEL